MCGLTPGQTQRELRPSGSLNHLWGHFFLGFLWPIILIFLVLSLHLILLRILQWKCTYLLARTDSREEAYEQVDIIPFFC